MLKHMMDLKGPFSKKMIRKGQFYLNHFDEDCNFLSVEVGEAARIYQSLLRQGLIVRPVAGYRMPRHLRVTVGLPEENAACLAALERALAEAA